MLFTLAAYALSGYQVATGPVRPQPVVVRTGPGASEQVVTDCLEREMRLMILSPCEPGLAQ